MSIVDVIERAGREPPFAHPDDPFPDSRYVCKVTDPIPWDKYGLEQRLGFEIPPELATLWDACGGLVLYEDDTFGQWGLVICPPTDNAVFPPSKSTFFNLNREYQEDKADRVLPGDLIIGRFWGDRERPLLRCDKNASDYGSIEIVSEMGPRDEWHKAAPSLEEFLVRFMDAHGQKYWEYHYQKELAERAAQELLRSKRVN